jgi:hypothetical protein
MPKCIILKGVNKINSPPSLTPLNLLAKHLARAPLKHYIYKYTLIFLWPQIYIKCCAHTYRPCSTDSISCGFWFSLSRESVCDWCSARMSSSKGSLKEKHKISHGEIRLRVNPNRFSAPDPFIWPFVTSGPIFLGHIVLWLAPINFTVSAKYSIRCCPSLRLITFNHPSRSYKRLICCGH